MRTGSQAGNHDTAGNHGSAGNYNLAGNYNNPAVYPTVTPGRPGHYYACCYYACHWSARSSGEKDLVCLTEIYQ